jgi:small subunit ribosomal protein S20
MPVIKSAKKKLKQDIKREKVNNLLKTNYRNAVKEAQKGKTAEKIKKAVKLVDKSAQKGLIHKNKAARIKSSLSKLIKPIAAKTKTAVKQAKKTKISKVKK